MRQDQPNIEMRTTKVGIREFRSSLAEFIAAATPVAVTRHGHTVAYFIPTSAEFEADVKALEKAAVALDRLAAPAKKASRHKPASQRRMAQVKQNRKNG